MKVYLYMPSSNFQLLKNLRSSSSFSHSLNVNQILSFFSPVVLIPSTSLKILHFFSSFFFFLLFSPDMNPPCTNSPDKFCYVCGNYTASKNRHKISTSPSLHENYLAYFGFAISDQDKWYVPHFVCSYCYSTLAHWRVGKARSMPFGTPTLWAEPCNHPDDCYFCNTPPMRGFNKKFKDVIEYPNVPSVTRPKEHGPQLPIPVPIRTAVIRGTYCS